MCITRYSLGHGLPCAVHLYMGYFVQYTYMGTIWEAFAAALGLHWSDTIVMLCEVMKWLHYGYAMTASTAAASARREAVLWLPCQPGENKCLCISYGSLHLLPAS